MMYLHLQWPMYLIDGPLPDVALIHVRLDVDA